MLLQRPLAIIGLCGIFAAGFPDSAAGALTIRNEHLTVEFDEASGWFTLTAAGAAGPFVRNGRFRETPLDAKVIEVTHETLGRGQAIETSQASGGRDQLALYPGQPFVFVHSRLHNDGTEPVVHNRVEQAMFSVDLGLPARSLRTAGTGRLRAVDRHAGSFAFLAVADPQSNRGVVSGWLTHDRGSGVITSAIEEDQAVLRARLEHGRLRLAAGQEADLDTLMIGYFNDARLGLEQWADSLARHYKINLAPQPVGYCTWYSSPHGRAADERRIVELAEFAAEHLHPFGFDVVQIDDYWQIGQRRQGPAKNFTGVNPRGPYPNGMKPPADRIRELGMTPGLWLMPFAGDHLDQTLFANHPEWFVRNREGEFFEERWGGTSLDMTHPGARAYTELIVRRIVHEWGYKYLKLDGLWTGMATGMAYVQTDWKQDNIGRAVFHDPNKTNIEVYRDGLKLVRQTAGNDVYILGCNMAQNMRILGASIGLVSGMRVGPDNGSGWDRLMRGVLSGSSLYFLHGRVWHNDPDPIYVRQNMPLKHAQMIISWVTVSGQLNLVSEWLPGLPAERLDLLKRTMPSHNLKARPVDFFENDPARVWVLTDDRGGSRRDVVALYNFGNSEMRFNEPVERLELPASGDYVAFDYWANELIPSFGGRLDISLEGQSCRILSVRPKSPNPQLVSTSRHITQGIIDVMEERWDPGSSTLVGRSRVVGGDAYELRIADGAAGRWQVRDVAVAPADAQAGVKVAVESAAAGLVRVRIDAPENREVQWAVRFQQ